MRRVETVDLPVAMEPVRPRRSILVVGVGGLMAVLVRWCGDVVSWVGTRCG